MRLMDKELKTYSGCIELKGEKISCNACSNYAACIKDYQNYEKDMQSKEYVQ